MAYRTVLAVIHDTDALPGQLAAGAALVRRWDAHLELLCLGIDEVQVGYYFAGADAVIQQSSIALAREKADSLRAEAERRATAEGIRFSIRAAVTQFGVLNEVVARAARYADLVVQPAIAANSPDTEAEAVVEAAMFSGRAPVLLVPETGLPSEFPRRAVIGWNDGTEALAAVRGALPALRAVDTAVVAIIDPPARAAGESEPGQGLATMLDRHGVTAELALLPKDQPRVSDILAGLLTDRDADLLVAGAYGHSRFREAILGGATRELMRDCPTPLIMAH